MIKLNPEVNKGWRYRLMPHQFDWIAALLYAGSLFVVSYFAIYGILPVRYPWLSVLAVFGVVLLLIIIDRLEHWRYGDRIPRRKLALLLLLRLGLITGAGFSDGFGLLLPSKTIVGVLILFGMFFLIGSSFGLSGQALTFYLLGRVRIALGGIEEVSQHDGSLMFFVTFSLGLVFIFAIAYLLQQERNSRWQTEKLLTDLKFSHRQLQRYAEQVAELAATEERNRLAREIHDSLGHYMTVINVQLEKAIVFRDRNPAEADRAVKDAKYMAGEALKDVRRSVGTLRNPEPFSLKKSVTRLVNNIATDRLAVDLDIQGDEAGFSKQSLMTLFRAVQEGLTNVQKHAEANQVTVRIQLKKHQADLLISDNGQGFDTAIISAPNNTDHYGLQGVRERVELIHGSLKLETHPNSGTSLLITVPKNPLTLAVSEAD